MVFRYGAGESRYTEEKVHTPEKQFSPVVYFDAPRCILCFRCVRICNEGMGVAALGVINRGVVSEIAPNEGDHLELRRVRHVHRYLPGGRAHQRGLSLSDTPVGDDARGHHLHALRRWLQDHARHAQRPDHSRQQPRPLRHQRRVPLHQGPLRVRFLRSCGAPASAADARERQVGRGVLVASSRPRWPRSSPRNWPMAARSA